MTKKQETWKSKTMNSKEKLCRLCLRAGDKLESLLNDGGNVFVSKAVVDLFNIKVNITVYKRLEHDMDKFYKFFLFRLINLMENHGKYVVGAKKN